jgi:hypothetical protein
MLQFIQTAPICFHLIIIRTSWHKQGTASGIGSSADANQHIRFRSFNRTGRPTGTVDAFTVTDLEHGHTDSVVKYDGSAEHEGGLPMHPVGNSAQGVLVTQEQWTSTDSKAHAVV